MGWFFYVLKSVMIFLLVSLSRWRVKGVENVPMRGGLLIVANHISLVDPPLVAASVKRRVVFLAKEELFRTAFWRKFFIAAGAIPVYRGRLNRGLFDRIEGLLKQGEALVMFPEGTRSVDAKLQPPLPGSALIAVRSGVPILPVGITGTEELRTRGWILRRPEIMVNIGTVFYLPSVSGKISKGELIDYTNTIVEHIAELLPEEYCGVYGGQGSVVDGVKD